MNRRVRQKREKRGQARERFGTDPTPAETMAMLGAALSASTDAASCHPKPGVWRPLGSPAVVPDDAFEPVLDDVDEPIACEEAPHATPANSAEPWYDDDVVALQVVAAEERSGIDAWTNARILHAEEAVELAELEALLAEEAASAEYEEDAPEATVGADLGAAGRLAEIAVDAAFMTEWETYVPLTAGITDLPLRQLAELVHVGPVVSLLADGKPVLDAFEARHARARTLLEQVGEALAEEHVPPEALVASALESRVSAALNRVLTAEALRLPQEIRRVVVEFRQARDGRTLPLRAFVEANANLERAHILLDECETGVRAAGPHPPLREVRRYGELVDICEAGFEEIARIEAELSRVADDLELYRGSFLALCGRARETASTVAQVRAAAQMLRIPLSATVADQTERETRRLVDAVDTYTAEMDAGFDAPGRNLSVRRLESELPARKEFYATLTRPRAENFFKAPLSDRDEEIRRLILITYDVTCPADDRRVKGRSIRAVAMSIMVRAGFVREEEADRAKDLFASKDATEWRQAHFDHTTVGQRGHIYIPNAEGRKLAKTYARELASLRDFTERVLRALQEHRAAVALEQEIKKGAAKV